MRLPRLTSRNLFFAVYGLSVTVLFLYILFPADLFKEFCEFKASAVLTDGECRIGNIDYHFPNTVVFEDVTMESGKGDERSVLKLKFVAVSNRSFKFWKEFELYSELFSGTLTSDIEIDWRSRKFEMDNVAVHDVDLGIWEKEESLTQREVSGMLSFSGDYQGLLSTPFSGKGKGNFALVESKMELVQPILSLSELSFTRLESELKYEDGVMYFINGEFIGAELSGDFSGVAKMNRPLVKSTLTVGGHLEPQPTFLRNHPREQRLIDRLLRRYKTQKLPFQVGGTLRRPTFRFAT